MNIFILVTYLLDSILKLQGEFGSKSLVSLKGLMYRTYRNILVQRKFRYSERAKRGLNEAVEWKESKTIYDNECPIYR